MSIDINGVNPGYAGHTGQTPQVSVARTESTAAQDETGRSSTSDTVTLTDMAQQLLSLSKAAASQPVVDTQRVEEARNSLRNGTHDFDAQRVAEKFRQFETQLNEA